MSPSGASGEAAALFLQRHERRGGTEGRLRSGKARGRVERVLRARGAWAGEQGGRQRRAAWRAARRRGVRGSVCARACTRPRGGGAWRGGVHGPRVEARVRGSGRERPGRARRERLLCSTRERRGERGRRERERREKEKREKEKREKEKRKRRKGKRRKRKGKRKEKMEKRKEKWERRKCEEGEGERARAGGDCGPGRPRAAFACAQNEGHREMVR